MSRRVTQRHLTIAAAGGAARRSEKCCEGSARKAASHWQLYKKPAPECWEGSYWKTLIVVYDDGIVEVKGTY
jgi:hypothetical protein